MNTTIDRKRLNFYARIGGLSYLIFVLSGFIMNFVLNRKLVDVSEATLTNIFQNEMHFRLGIFAEITIFVAVLSASICFYRICCTIDKNLAQVTMCCRLVELIIGGVAAIVCMSMLVLVNSPNITGSLDAEQLWSTVLIVGHFNNPAYHYSYIFMGIGAFITFYQFFKTIYIPRVFSVWGMFTYASMGVYPVAKILIPDLPKETMYILFPGALFELTVSLWLIFRGLDFSAEDKLRQARELVKQEQNQKTPGWSTETL